MANASERDDGCNSSVVVGDGCNDSTQSPIADSSSTFLNNITYSSSDTTLQVGTHNK